MVSLPLPVQLEGWVGGEVPSTLLSFCLSSRYYSSSVATRTVSLGPVVLLLSFLPLYSCVCLSLMVGLVQVDMLR